MSKICAIYTRKSHAEGLDQDFNSLDAQREACEAFIKSQQHEGWVCDKTRYDDGAYSGGNLQRPALSQLLDDIALGKIQVVVVYKVDRLTRCLADFAKLVELFDEHGVSFVAVTQQFNTTSSMGRLTLNVLLSFAQFEREITGERIRDKFRASKEKGMWMGGYVPLGYDVQDRRLQVNTTEAKTINEIYSQYLVLRSVKSLKQHLDNQGIVSKQRVSSDGKHTGGKPISRGNLYRILSNPIYKGEIRHKQETHPGQHEAIIDPDTWDQVQQLLASNNDSAKKGLKAKQPSLLAGLLFDDKGHPMSPSHAVKNGKRYRYYTSQALIKQQHGKAGSLPRVPAAEIENIALLQVRQLLQDRNRMADILDGPIHEKEYALNQAQLVASTLEAKPYLLKDLISKVTISASKILIEVPISAVLKILNLPGAQNDHKIVLTEKIKLKRCQGEKRLILENGQPSQIDNLNPALIKAISRAYTWNQMLINGEADSLKSLAKMEQMTCRYIRKLLPLAYLPPSLIEDILSGKQDPNLSVESLC